jgi:Flp pilus assembly protein TadD
MVWFSPPAQDWWIARQPLEKLANAVREQPGSTRARFHYIHALLRAGRNDEAWRQGREAAALDPRDARLQSAAGLSAAASGDVAAALPLLENGWELGDSSGPALERLGALQLALDRLGPALQVLEECVRLHPRRVEAWHLLGECRARMLMLEGWTQAMEKVAELSPADPRGWIGQSESWLFREHPDRAVIPARKATRLTPGSAAAQLVLARAEEALGHGVAADLAFRRSIDLTETGSREWLAANEAYGSFLTDSGDPAAAASLLEAVRKLQPEESSAVYLLSRALRAAGRTARATEMLRRFEAAGAKRREQRYLRSRIAADPNNAELRRRLLHASGAR